MPRQRKLSHKSHGITIPHSLSARSAYCTHFPRFPHISLFTSAQPITKTNHFSRSITLELIFLFIRNYLGLSILIKGSASCNYSKDLQAEQEFFSNDKDVDFEPELNELKAKSDSLELPTGTHRFEFSHRLPRNIPYSVEGQYGNVKYLVQGTTIVCVRAIEQVLMFLLLISYTRHSMGFVW